MNSQKYFLFFNIRLLFCFVTSLPGEVTEDELFNRLQQIKDGPEQQNNTPSAETGEDPVGKFAPSVLFRLYGSLSNSDMICHSLTSLIFQYNQKALRILPVGTVSWTG